MMELLIVNNERLEEGFLDFPDKLYANDPYWVSPNREHVRQLAGFGNHGFYAHAQSQAFVVMKESTVAGRVVAINHEVYRRWNPDFFGYFGFFECVNDPEVAQALLTAAGNWLGEQGCRRMRGPINPSLNYTAGIQVKDFQRLPTVDMPHTCSWYPELFESVGLEAERDLVSYLIDLEQLRTLDPKIERTAELTQSRFGIEMRHFSMANYLEDFKKYVEVFNQTLPLQWGAVPIMPEEIEPMARSYQVDTVDRFTAFAEIEGQTIGVIYGIPDINPLLKELDVSELEPGWSKNAQWRSRIKRVRLAVTLVLPEFNLWGIGPLLNWYLLNQVANDPHWNSCIQEVEYSWILDINQLSRGTIERAGGMQCGTHRLYCQNLI